MATKKLTNQRKVAIARIIETFNLAIKSQSDDTVKLVFKASYDSLDDHYDQFKTIHNEIIGLLGDSDAEFDAQDKIRKDTDSFYHQARAIFSTMFPSANYSGFTPSIVNNSYRDELEPLKIPTFNGNLKKWPTFFDVFTSLVHDNTNYSDIKKFQHLLSCLEGEPLNILNSIRLTSSNYDIAWNALTERYQNKRLLASTYWNSIYNANSIKNNTPKELRSLVDTFVENIAALKNLGFPVDAWCFCLFSILLSKIDTSTRTAFELKFSTTEIPTYQNLIQFLTNQCKALETMQTIPQSENMQPSTSKQIPKNNNSNYQFKKNNSYSQNQYKSNTPSNLLVRTPAPAYKPTNNQPQLNQNSTKCKLCNNSYHPLSQCGVFITKTPSERFNYVKQQNACVNCLRANHYLQECTSTFNCKICRHRHHTLLHLPQITDSYRQNPNPTYNQSTEISPNPNSNSNNSNLVYSNPNFTLNQNQMSNQFLANTSLIQTNPNLNQGNFNAIQEHSSQIEANPNEIQRNMSLIAIDPNPNNLCTSPSTPTTVLLATIKLEVLDVRGNYQTVRALLDSGSQINLISDSCINRLGIRRNKNAIPVLGINQSSSSTNGVATCTIRPLGQTQPTFHIQVFILPKLCANMPSMQIDFSTWSHISNLKLADDQFNIPAPIDMLLGAQIFTEILRTGRIQGPPGQPSAFETIFGWVFLGQTQNIDFQPHISSYFISCEQSLDSSIRKFWELEAIKPKTFLSPEEKRCEEIYQKTTTRDTSGRFTVNLPFRHIDPPNLGDTYSIAYRLFMSLESRLLKNPSLYSLYADFMSEYLKNGHMSLIPKTESRPNLCCYLPHHGVLRLDKSTTKLRVVFNPSVKGSNGTSLNETLLTGPKLQNDICEILLKFRFYSVVLLADIKQHFLQIQVNPIHRNYQRLLWRFHPSEPLQEYRLNTVTFGISSSPYLAIRTLRELATRESQTFPEASQVLLNNIFMDDICCGSSSLEGALSLQRDLITLLKLGKFELRKWASNNPKLISHLSPSDCQIPITFENDNSASIKVLGLQWHPSTDTFTYSCTPSEKTCTKRSILSAIAKIWDPLGFLSPVSFFAKVIMQKLWLCNIDWDETPPESITTLWKQFSNQLNNLSSICLPRHIFPNKIQRCQLLGFCDASELGYACCVYIRVELPNNIIKSSLVAGKSRVAPLHTKSIPRLELLGATLLADLLELVIRNYSSLILIDEILAFSDSRVALHWVTSSPHKWKTFVANRVSHIQETIQVPWYHIPSLENPADCASRGLTPNSLINHPLWFHGPPWVILPTTEWKIKKFVEEFSEKTPDEVIKEEKPLNNTVLVVESHTPNFFDNLISKFSNLTLIQKIICHFLRLIHNRKNLKNPILGPFAAFELHKALLVLVKRVQEECFPDIISKIQKNELLPKPYRKLAPFLDESGLVRVGGRLRHSQLSFEAKHPLLLPKIHHLTNLIITQTHIENLHPGLNTVQYLIRQKFWIISARKAIQKVLSQCIRCARLKPKSYTPYMADLPDFRTSQLKCFSHVCLDYAGPIKSFVGQRRRGAQVTKSYIAVFVDTCVKAIHIELVSSLTTEACIAALRRFVARRGTCVQIVSDQGSNFVGAIKELQNLSRLAAESLNIKWYLNSPGAPHLNGLAEAGVKSVKTHLYRVIGNQILTFEELYTLLSQIEALLNSRPLWEQSSDPNDLSPLTPGHFLTTEPLNSCPDPDLSSLKLNTLNRWQLIQRLHSDFWKRWKNEYLNTLQQRCKWSDPSVEIKLGALVLIKDEARPPLHWSLGRIVTVHPGPDGHVRIATVKTQHGLLTRPVVKLCPLLLDSR